MAEQELLLDLSTVIERPRIAIDTKLYDMRSPDELSVADTVRLAAMGKRVSAIGSGEVDGKEEELAAVLKDIVAFILPDTPRDVLAKLADRQRMRIAEVFMRLLRPEAAGATAAVASEETGERTGAKPSRGSSASTAATPGAG